MGLISKIANSSDLASGMMNRLNADFTQELLHSPETSAQKYTSIVFRCAGCTQQAACAQLQADHAQLDQAPAYCRNKDVLDARIRA